MKLNEISDITALPSALSPVKVGDYIRVKDSGYDTNGHVKDELVVEVRPKNGPNDPYGPYINSGVPGRTDLESKIPFNIRHYWRVQLQQDFFGKHLVLVDTKPDGSKIWEFQKRRIVSKKQKQFMNKMTGNRLGDD